MGLKVGASIPGQNARQDDLFQQQCWKQALNCWGATRQGPSVQQDNIQPLLTQQGSAANIE